MGAKGGGEKNIQKQHQQRFFFPPTVGLLNIASSTFPARRRRETIKALLLFPLNRENLHTAALTNATCVNSHACTRTHTRTQTHKQCIAGHMRPGVRWRVPARKPLCVIKHMPQCRRSSQKKKKKSNVCHPTVTSDASSGKPEICVSAVWKPVSAGSSCKHGRHVAVSGFKSLGGTKWK